MVCNQQPLPMVKKPETALLDPYRKWAKVEMLKEVEEELAKVAGNNWPKATKTILKKYQHLDISVEKALKRVQGMVEQQMTYVDEHDDFTDVLWILIKTRQYDFIGRTAAAGLAIMHGKFWMLHYLLKQGRVNPYLAGSEKRADTDRFFSIELPGLVYAYSEGYGFSSLIFTDMPIYRRNKGIYKNKKEPSYKKWRTKFEDLT